jgi:hypothetical protein
MRQAFAPEYATLNRDPVTKSFIEQINALKAATDPGPGLDIPADCTGPAAAKAAQAPVPSTSVVAVATALDGTYRWALASDDVFTITMNEGHWTLRHGGDSGEVEGDGTYTVDGDQVNFDWDGNLLSFAFTVDSDATLHLVAQPPTSAGDARVWATKPWTKIAAGSDTAPTALDGTYRWTLTKDDALTKGLPGDRTPEILATFPSTFTMTMDAGTWQLASQGPHGDSNPDAGHGSYTVKGDHIVFHEAAEQFDYTYTVDSDGTLHLVAQPPINPGPAWIFATNPWTKIN